MDFVPHISFGCFVCVVSFQESLFKTFWAFAFLLPSVACFAIYFSHEKPTRMLDRLCHQAAQKFFFWTVWTIFWKDVFTTFIIEHFFVDRGSTDSNFLERYVYNIQYLNICFDKEYISQNKLLRRKMSFIHTYFVLSWKCLAQAALTWPHQQPQKQQTKIMLNIFLEISWWKITLKTLWWRSFFLLSLGARAALYLHI